MTGLAEIEAAVEQLPETEQKALLSFLQNRIERNRESALSQAQNESWMDRLEKLRSSLGPPAPEGSTQRILDEIREDRF